MSGSLDGVALKIERARSHLHAINHALEEFIKTAFDECSSYCEVNTGKNVLALGKIRHPEPGLAVVIGDFLHNARGALDHLAYQVVMNPRDEGGPKAPEDKIMFQICDLPDSFERTKWKVRGAAPGALAVIERLQPYNRGQPYLWLLHELNNWDKHRLTHAVENTLIEVNCMHPERLDVFEIRVPGELEDDAILARWKATPGPDPDVDVGLYFGTEVTFEDGPGARRQVRGVLTGMLLFAEEAIEELTPFVAV